MDKKIIVLITLLLVSSAYAQTFDYVQNPSNDYVRTFQGSWSSRINDVSTPKTGYFYLETVARNRYCMGGSLNSTTSTIITTGGVKNGGDCNGITDVGINVYVDNQNYYTTPYAHIGDYDKVNEHITVVPYSYNVWFSKDVPTTNNYAICNQVLSTPYSVSTVRGIPDALGNCRPENMFSYYEYYLNKKKNVCNANVLFSLVPALKSNYYTSPSDLFVGGFGTIDNTNCNNLMFPENSNLKDRVNSIYQDQPEIFNSLFYDSNLQYEAYPFYIYGVESTCFDATGKLLSSTNSEDTYSVNIDQYSYTQKRYPAGDQYYSWSRTNDFVVKTPESTEQVNKDNGFLGERKSIANKELNRAEVNEYHTSFSCPAGTTYYTTTLILKKNQNYRHKSPVDFTYHWTDIFNVSTNSNFYNGILSIADPKEQYVVYTQAGGFSLGTTPQNNVITSNDMNNTVRETNTSTTTTSMQVSQDCFSCNQNITVGGTNLTIAGGGSGGSSINNGIDDSAVSGLMQQSAGQNDATVKAGFIEKLLIIAEAILAIIIVMYSLWAILVIMMFFFTLFSIPKKMGESIKMLFDAGVRK